ncbi:hypothetical protein MyNCGM683_21500 [Achromobacter xylosoxidans]
MLGARFPIDNPSRFKQMNDWQIYNAGSALRIEARAAELNKLSFGGLWSARLVINHIESNHMEETITPWTIDIVVQVKDSGHMAVLFPGAGESPRVDLNLHRHDGGKSLIWGSASLDMCLYDGFNSNSTWYDVTLTDGLGSAPPNRRAGMFSITRDGAANAEDSRRVDYQVSLSHHGQQFEMKNGNTVRFPAIAPNDQLRRVRIDGIATPVYCVPTPLTLETPAFETLSKEGGNYSGKLRVTFSPSL